MRRLEMHVDCLNCARGTFPQTLVGKDKDLSGKVKALRAQV